MGGAAFAQAAAPGAPTLSTPRMTPDEYEAIKTRWLARLKDYLGAKADVTCFIEAPEKKDYGDIDLFVTCEESTLDFVDIAVTTGAAGVIVQHSRECSLAVLKDEERGQQGPTVVYQALNGTGASKTASSETTVEEYAQIDLMLVEPALLPWSTFYTSYGDMCGLLGRIVTALGFRVSNTGFWLRLWELDRSKKVHGMNFADKDGLILLSDDPEKVMEFLGLSRKEYYQGFQTLEQFFEWLAACRLLVPEAVRMSKENPHERRRVQNRKVYTHFFYEWLPGRIGGTDGDVDDEQRKAAVRQTRSRLAEEAISFFDRGQEHEVKRTALVLATNRTISAALIRPLLAEHSGKADKSLVELAKAFRRQVGCSSEGKPYILPKPRTDVESEIHGFVGQDGETLRDPEGMSVWVRDNWEAVRQAEKLSASVRSTIAKSDQS